MRASLATNSQDSLQGLLQKTTSSNGIMLSILHKIVFGLFLANILDQLVHGFFGGSRVVQIDTVVHLGITLSVSGSHLPYVLQKISSARRAFYAIHSVNPRGGCLYPNTSLKLFKLYPLSILQCGLDVY